MRRARAAVVAIIGLAMATGILMAQRRPRPVGIRVPVRGGETMSDDDAKKGLVFRLSEGGEETAPVTAARVAEARPLSEAEARSVLERLPELKTGDDDRRDFALRERSLPPPRTGATVAGIFPPK